MPVVGRAFAEGKQLSQPRLDEPSLLRVEQVLLQRRVQLAQRLVGLLVLDDPAPPADDVRERPVRDALSVGEAAATVPVDRLDHAVEDL